jgi:N-acetyl-gamma-glutamyl-phosphate reductase
MYVPLSKQLSVADAVELWQSTFADEPFVEIHDALPSLKDVVGRNVVSIGFSEVENAGSPLLIVVAALDNLVKGAAGQAIQNANLMFGFDETEGLPL